MLINDEPKNPIHRSHQKVPLAFNASYKPFLTLESELGLGRVQTRPEIWPVVPLFLKTWTEPGLFLRPKQLKTPELGFFETQKGYFIQKTCNFW